MLPFQALQMRATSSGGGGGGASDRWRILINTTQGATNTAGIGEIEMRSAYGGSDQCSGGTAVAISEQTGGEASKGFDNNTGTRWLQSGNTRPAWIEYQFTSSLTVKEIALTVYSGGGSDMPIAGDVQHYVGGSWTTAWSFTTPSNWGDGQTRIFNDATVPAGASTEWRLNITSRQNAGSWTSIRELEMRATSGGADLCTAGIAAVSAGGPADGAFDNNTGTRWTSTGSGLPVQISYQFFTAPVEIVEISLMADNGNDTPIAFDVQYKDSGGTWQTHWSVTTPATWTTGETRVFTKP